MPLPIAFTAQFRKLLPDCCPRCSQLTASGYCRACREDFRRIDRACRDCGLPRPCHPCPALDPDWRLGAILAPFSYQDPLARQIKALKYGRHRLLGAALGELLAEALASRLPALDALVPVPLHPRRLRERTFNQADEIAQALARMLGIPLLVRGICRTQATRAQTGLGRELRRTGLHRAFRVRNKAVRGLRLAVVDDVITTAATANSLAAALHAAGARSVLALAVARTTAPAPDSAQFIRKV